MHVGDAVTVQIDFDAEVRPVGLVADFASPVRGEYLVGDEIEALFAGGRRVCIDRLEVELVDPGLEVGDMVRGQPDATFVHRHVTEDIGARATAQGVGPCVAIDFVVAVAAENDVRSAPAEDGIVARRAVDRIGQVAAAYHVVAGAGMDIVARIHDAVDLVRARRAVDTDGHAGADLDWRERVGKGLAGCQRDGHDTVAVEARAACTEAAGPLRAAEHQIGATLQFDLFDIADLADADGAGDDERVDLGAAIDDRAVGSCSHDDAVVAAPAVQDIRSAAPVDDVLARAALDQVDAVVAVQRCAGIAVVEEIFDIVGQGVAVDARAHRIMAFAGKLDDKVTGVIDDVEIVAHAAFHPVGPEPAVEQVVAAKTNQGIGAGKSVKMIFVRVAGQDIIARIAVFAPRVDPFGPGRPGDDQIVAVIRKLEIVAKPSRARDIVKGRTRDERKAVDLLPGRRRHLDDFAAVGIEDEQMLAPGVEGQAGQRRIAPVGQRPNKLQRVIIDQDTGAIKIVGDERAVAADRLRAIVEALGGSLSQGADRAVFVEPQQFQLGIGNIRFGNQDGPPVVGHGKNAVLAILSGNSGKRPGRRVEQAHGDPTRPLELLGEQDFAVLERGGVEKDVVDERRRELERLYRAGLGVDPAHADQILQFVILTDDPSQGLKFGCDHIAAVARNREAAERIPRGIGRQQLSVFDRIDFDRSCFGDVELLSIRAEHGILRRGAADELLRRIRLKIHMSRPICYVVGQPVVVAVTIWLSLYWNLNKTRGLRPLGRATPEGRIRGRWRLPVAAVMAEREDAVKFR